MLKFSVGFFIVLLAGTLASGGSKKPGTAKPGAISKEQSSALLGKGSSEKGLTKSLGGPKEKPAQSGQLGGTRRSTATSNSGFAGHSDKPAVSSKYQGFPGHQ